PCGQITGINVAILVEVSGKWIRDLHPSFIHGQSDIAPQVVIIGNRTRYRELIFERDSHVGVQTVDIILSIARGCQAGWATSGVYLQEVRLQSAQSLPPVIITIPIADVSPVVTVLAL